MGKSGKNSDFAGVRCSKSIHFKWGEELIARDGKALADDGHKPWFSRLGRPHHPINRVAGDEQAFGGASFDEQFTEK